MTRAVMLAICASALLTACGGAGSKDPNKISLTFQTQLDSGNAAYRRGDYKASAQFFHAAARTDPENLSGWYGVYMAESKLGNTEEAAKARAIVAQKAPDMPLTAHPTAKDHPAGSLDAPLNPHVPQSGEQRAKVPLDSVRAAKTNKDET